MGGSVTHTDSRATCCDAFAIFARPPGGTWGNERRFRAGCRKITVGDGRRCLFALAMKAPPFVVTPSPPLETGAGHYELIRSVKRVKSHESSYGCRMDRQILPENICPPSQLCGDCPFPTSTSGTCVWWPGIYAAGAQMRMETQRIRIHLLNLRSV